VALRKQGLERSERGVQTEETIEIESRLGAGTGAWDGYGGAEIVIGRVAVRDDDVQAVGGAALEDGDQSFPAGAAGGSEGSLEPQGGAADAHHGQGGIA
jgi:hypothetical protein